MKFRPTPPEIREMIAPAIAETRAATIERHLKAVRLFRELDNEITVAQIDFFFHVARIEGCCLTEVALSAGVKQTTASQFFKKLSVYKTRGRDGLGLLRNVENPANRRQRLILLTSLGEALLDRLE